jgi:hypothetical protein
MKLWLSWSRNDQAAPGHARRQDGWDCQSGQPHSGAGDPGSRNRRHPSQRCSPSELVLAEIDKQAWSPGLLINVIVRDGVVELWGTILDERKRQALRIVAENVPGTRQVKDHLVSVEPMSGMVFEAPDQGYGPIASLG